MQPFRLILATLRIVAGAALVVAMLKIAPTIASHAAGHSVTYTPTAAAMTAPRTQ